MGRLVRRSVVTCCVSAALLGANVFAACAQELAVFAGRQTTDHELLGTPLGLGASLTIPVTGYAALRVSAFRADDDFRSVGSTCVGLILPGQDFLCLPETRADAAEVDAWSATAIFSVTPVRRVRLSFVPGWIRTSVRSSQTGLSTDRVRSARKTFSGYRVGAELGLDLVGDGRVGLTLGAHEARHPWFADERVIDGYSPFEQELTTRWLEAGLSVRLGSGAG